MTAVNLATADLFQAEIARLQAENERLRTMAFTPLTDAEREALEWAIFEYGATHPDHGLAAERAATLRGLLERTQTVET